MLSLGSVDTVHMWHTYIHASKILIHINENLVLKLGRSTWGSMGLSNITAVC